MDRINDLVEFGKKYLLQILRNYGVSALQDVRGLCLIVFIAPNTAPRDLTPVAKPGEPTWVVLSWQPPRQANGRVTGNI